MKPSSYGLPFALVPRFVFFFFLSVFLFSHIWSQPADYKCLSHMNSFVQRQSFDWKRKLNKGHFLYTRIYLTIYLATYIGVCVKPGRCPRPVVCSSHQLLHIMLLRNKVNYLHHPQICLHLVSHCSFLVQREISNK